MIRSFFQSTGLVAGLLLVLAPGWAQGGGVMREFYPGIAGTSVADLVGSPTFPDQPALIEFVEEFEAPTGVGDDYGQRLRGYLLPPVSGAYRFWIASDDASDLYLSTDDTAANKQRIAWVSDWTNSREWNKYDDQESAWVTLTQGQRYYIEALMKEGQGGDNLAVRWQLPGGDIEEPIPGIRLEPVGLEPPLIIRQPASIQVPERGEAAFSIGLEQAFGAGYQWQRDGTDIPGATGYEFRFSPVQVTDDQAGFRCVITNGLGSVISAVATLEVTPDTTRPTVLHAATVDGPNRISVVFSEDVEPATALDVQNYVLGGGASVQSVRFAGALNAVVLEVSPLTAGEEYPLAIRNIRDQAASPNAILPGTSVVVAFSTVPLDLGLIRREPEPLGPSRRRSGLVLSEIMYNPAPRTDGLNLEFVEIYNSEEIAVDLAGYRLSGDIDFMLPPGTVLPAHGFLVVAPAPADVESVYGGSGVLGGFPDRLSNGGGMLRLRNRLNAVLCEVEFDDGSPWPAAADNGGHSLVLARPSYGEDDVRAWAASAFIGGSPGAAEPAIPTIYGTVMINEILSHTDDPLVDYVELYNYGSSPVDLAGCILTDDPASNRYRFATGTLIPGQGFLLVDQTALGFALSAAGETVYFKTPDGTRVIDAIRFGPQASGMSWGRTPDGAPRFDELSALTPGTTNASAQVREVVINELMYHPPTGDSADEFIELHQVGDAPVDLSGWRLRGGIAYTFPAGTALPAGGFLVVANDRIQLLANHPGLDPAQVQGDYSGSLADGGERVWLELPEDIVTLQNEIPVTNTVYITVDDVTYGDGGRWGRWADGGGSSLELIDPRADNRQAMNWADSDETAKGEWVTVEHTGILDHGNGAIDELQVLLLGAGECLLDDIQVTSDGSPNRVVNGTFESGVEAWVIQGNHIESGWSQLNEGYAGYRALHLRAGSGGDNGANRIETDLSSSLPAGNTATLQARARWLRGHPDLLLRLRGNHLEALGSLPIPTDLGTPGMRNSRAQNNAGPTISDVTHAPVLPGHQEPVTILARVADPDGLSKLVVQYRLDPAEDIRVAPMTNRGAGWFAASLPGQPAGTLIAYRVEAVDATPASLVATFPMDSAGRECLIRFGEPTPGGNFGIYRLWMTQANLDTWASREELSNQPLDGTLVLGDYRVVYNGGARYRGSPFIRRSFDSPLGNLCAYVWSLPKDEPVLGTDELNLDTLEPGRDDTRQRERTSFWIAEQLGVPFSYQRYVRILFNGAQRGDLYSDSQQPNGDFIQSWFPADDRGEIFKIDDWFEFDDSFGFSYITARLQDFTTTGGVKKKARYRWSWERKSNRGLDDDYTRLFELVDALNLVDPAAYVTTVEALVDVEQWMRIFAARRIVGDWDGYSFERGKNQFAYKPEHEGWKMLLWDLDFSLGGGGREPTHGLFAGVEDPTVQRMYGTPALVRAYWRALYDAVYGPLESSRVEPVLAAQYAALLANGISVANPANRLTSWIAERRSYILSQLATVAADFAVTSNGGNDFSSPVNLVTLTGTAPVQVRTLTLNGVAYPVTWTSDTGWSLQVALGPGENALQVGGIDSARQPIPGLAESITITYTGPAEDPADALVINEIMYNAAVPDAAFVEIHNRSAETAFDLTGYGLDGADFEFPQGTVIEPGAFLVVANDLDAYLAAYGSVTPVVGIMNGRLDNGGETLRLVRLGATPDANETVDEVSYEDDPPWPGPADGFGPSLQLVDPAQDNNRVANWVANDGGGSGTGTNLLVDFADVWRYDDRAVDLGTGWREPGFDDDEWMEGAGLLGLESSALPEPIRTVLNLGARTFYFRTTFSLAGNPAETQLWLEHVLDDGMVMYLNGVEIWRLGVDAGPVSYSTFASRAVNNAVYEGPFALPASALVSGENVLAVEVHQVGATSSDVVMGLRLTAVSSSGAAYTPGAPNQASTALPVLPPLWLNELQPGNANGPLDAAGDADPWIELYNGGDTPVDLSTFRLSPDYGATAPWSFPPGASLGAGEYRVVWVDGEPSESTGTEYHTSFALPRYQGSVSLIQDLDGGLMVDYLNYGALPEDRSHGAWPDGTPAHRRTFFYATPGAANTTAYPATPVFINEWMSANTSTLYDPADGDADDWIELVNLGPAPVDLSGFHLTDDLTNPDQWVIPAATVMEPGGYLLVWADNETNQNQAGRTDLHAGFRLSRNGEQIGLYSPTAEPVDTLDFTAQADDRSSGRWPDGNAAITNLDPATPRGPNQVVTGENVAPVVGPVSPQSMDELSELRLAIPATDANTGQELTFTLAAGAPAGVTLNPQSGLLVWTPTEIQGPDQYPVTVIATDDGTPPLSNSTTFAITVREANQPPELAALPPRQLGEGALLRFQVPATDPDLPAQALRFSLHDGAPSGASIDPVTGMLNWIPDESQGPGAHELTVVVTDDGLPALNAAGTFTVTVDEVNAVPVVDPLADQQAWVDSQFGIQVVAHDPDLPATSLAYQVEPGAPTGASIDPATGWFRWTPSPAQAGSSHPVTVRVTDGGAPPLDATLSFSIQVEALDTLRILGATRAGANVIRLDWVLDPAGPNQIQISDQLEAADWVPHPEGAGVSNAPPVDLPLGDTPHRSYRIVVPRP